MRRACRADSLSGLYRRVGKFIERGALGVVRLDGLLNLIDREAGNIAAVIAAHLRK